MLSCFFVCDLHGRKERYRKLFEVIIEERPKLIFLGGDLLPHGMVPLPVAEAKRGDFVNNYLVPEFAEIQKQLAEDYPRIFIILGNDDARFEESTIKEVEDQGLWVYAHNRMMHFEDYRIYGYSYVPPTPFRLKDWERYDISRHVDPGCISPEEGLRSVVLAEGEIRYATIADDLEQLTGQDDLESALFLFHTPPYQTKLDRAALDGKYIDHVPLDVHVGSIAVRRFIEKRQPLVTLHGHIHESARLTGTWKDRLGNTTCLSAAHDGPELALVRFDLEKPEEATRELVRTHV